MSFLGSKFSPGVFWAPITPKMVLTGCQDIKTLGYKKFLELSPIEKKLVLPYQALRGRKFKMAATGRSYGGFLGNFSIWTQNRPISWGKLRNICLGGEGADTHTSAPLYAEPPRGSENCWKTSENISDWRIHDAHIQFLRRLTARAKNQIWPTIAWFGHTNFFSMGGNSKIFFSFIEFSYPGNSE